MRKSGLLLHISALPNDYGIGSLGKEAYEFVDFLVRCGQKIWQVLPLSPTSYGDSPYQSFSVFAGNPYFISLETLEERGLLNPEEYQPLTWRKSARDIDYGLLYQQFFPVMKKAFTRFQRNPDAEYPAWLTKNEHWVQSYGLFMALKSTHDGKPWNEWEPSLRCREPAAIAEAEQTYADEINFWCFLQYEFYRQWFQLKNYANANGMEIIGDIPIYCALDSVDVWCSPELFLLDENRNPTVVAGFPPDDFSPDGQLWGNPIYDWAQMAKENYAWWVERIRFSKTIYDTVRIDHFIGFNSYYAIPAGSKTAHDGTWCEGPKYPLFAEIKKQTGRGGIIAEDLGIITPAVRKLLRQCGYPGMKVLQFGFAPNSDYLPQNYRSPNCVVYTGTHDNETIAGWVKNAPKKALRFCKEYFGVRKSAELPWKFIELAWKSTARTAVTTIQDLCGYGNEARINTPSTLGQNWRWRAIPMDFAEEIAVKLKHLTDISNR